ncbi:MAG: ATP-grasp domain-containing protein [Clostridiales bacterium]|nr:ATP-grasp domain-containing protein [Clostridiales bacterium]
MKGIIVYNDESLSKNKFFAEKLKTELENLGVGAEIVCDGIEDMRPDFAVMRIYDERLNKHFDSIGVRTFNNSDVAAVCNDKWKTFLRLSQNGIPVAPTQKAEECDMPYPRIVKARHGHGGSEVFWAGGEAEFNVALSKTKDSAIVQPPVGKRGRDLRVYVIGGKPIVAMLRCSDVDFRSNFSLGGFARRYELSDREEELVTRIAKIFNFDFAGIDFLLGDDGLICNEIEDVVGCRMVYTYTDIDIIKKYAEHIVCSLNRR